MKNFVECLQTSDVHTISTENLLCVRVIRRNNMFLTNSSRHYKDNYKISREHNRISVETLRFSPDTHKTVNGILRTSVDHLIIYRSTRGNSIDIL